MRSLSQSGSLVTPAESGTYTAPTPAGRETLLSAISAPMRPAQAAFANRDNAKFNMLAFGDSMVEGGPGVSTGRSHRWLDRLAAVLRARYPLAVPVTGSTGYIPAFYQSFTAQGAFTTYALGSGGGNVYLPAEVTIADGGTALVAYGSGIGNRALGLINATQSMTFTFTGTGADLYLATHTTASTAAGIQVDGGTVTNYTLPSSTLATAQYQIRSLTAGSHTVKVTWVSTGPVVVNGLYPYNGDETKGLHIYDGGKGSSRADQFNAGAGGYNSRFWKMTSFIQPQLIVIAWGYNEYFGNYDPENWFRPNLQAVTSNALGNNTQAPTVVFIVWPRPAKTTNGAFSYQQYVNVIYAQAALTPNSVVVDFGKRIPAADVDNVLGLFYTGDKVHWSDVGAAYVADVLADTLSPR